MATAATPVKVVRDVCGGCGVAFVRSEKQKTRKIHSEKGKEEKLSQLLLEYGGVNIIEGRLCQPCYRELKKIEELALDYQLRRRKFWEKCQGHLVTVRGKRMAPESPSRSKTSASTTLRIQVVPAAPPKKLKPRQLLPKPLIPEPKPSSQPFEHSYASKSSTAETLPSKKSLASKVGKVLQREVPPKILTERERWNLIKQAQDATVEEVVADVVKNQKMENALIRHLAEQDTARIPSGLTANRSGLRSDTKAFYEDVSTFRWNDICEEAFNLFPVLFALILNIMLPSHRRSPADIEEIFPRIGMVYAIIMQTRIKQLSLVQRIISSLLMESICESKVFERLQRVGVALTYKGAVSILDDLKGSFNVKVIQAVKEERYLRFVGDNIDFRVGVRDERIDRHSKLHHYFGSAILVYDFKFPSLSEQKPQKDYRTMLPRELLPTQSDSSELIEDYVHLMMKVAVQYFPAFKFLEKEISRYPSATVPDILQKTLTIPLPALHKHEQKYGDVVDIMRFYEATLKSAYTQAGRRLTDDITVHIGGDQLTRERFSGAKQLVIGTSSIPTSAEDRFQHLSPITSEFFHLGMKFLGVIFKRLYKDGSGREIGTLRAEQSRISRGDVQADVKKAYTPCKEFLMLYLDCYIIEAICHHFQLDDQTKPLEIDVPDGPDAAFEWAKDEFKKMVMAKVGTFAYRKASSTHAAKQTVQASGHDVPMTPTAPSPAQPTSGATSAIPLGQTMQILLPNGKVLVVQLQLPVSRPVPASPEPDGVMSYGQQTLELGLLFRNFLESCATPNRERMLRTLKFIMIIIKTDNPKAKYADEILRLLLHQLSLLSERQAHEVFYALFVNMKGGIDSSMPADLWMERLVRITKKHVKHMVSNKTEQNIYKKTAALAALGSITSLFDEQSGVRVTQTKHKTVSIENDQKIILQDLRNVRPFEYVSGRHHDTFPSIKPSVLASTDSNQLHAWMANRIKEHGSSLGN